MDGALHHSDSSEKKLLTPDNHWKAWIIWISAAIFYLYEYILRVSPSVMTNELMQDFGVTSASLGVLVSFYYYAYVPLQIPCGVIVDKLGARRVVTFSSLFCTVGCVLFARSDNLAYAEFGRFLMGAGSACAYLSTAKIAAEWFSPRKFALLTSITMGMGTLGGTFGGKPFAVIVNSYGWRDAMMIAAAAGVCVTLTAWLFVRDKKDSKKPILHLATEETSRQTLLSGLKVVASNPQSWLIGLYGCFMYLPLSAFAELWGTPYLMQLHGINNETASSASVMVFIGMALGCPASAWLSDKVQSRIKIMGASAILTALLFLFIVYCPIIPLNLTFGLLFVTGFIAGGQILYFAAAKEINPPETSATTIGFTNTLVMVSGIIFQPLLGYLLDFVWDGTRTAEGIPLYTNYAYQIALSPVPLCLFASWFILKYVKETYPK